MSNRSPWERVALLEAACERWGHDWTWMLWIDGWPARLCARCGDVVSGRAAAVRDDREATPD